MSIASSGNSFRKRTRLHAVHLFNPIWFFHPIKTSSFLWKSFIITKHSQPLNCFSHSSIENYKITAVAHWFCNEIFIRIPGIFYCKFFFFFCEEYANPICVHQLYIIEIKYIYSYYNIWKFTRMILNTFGRDDIYTFIITFIRDQDS